MTRAPETSHLHYCTPEMCSALSSLHEVYKKLNIPEPPGVAFHAQIFKSDKGNLIKIQI
jgi:hypothetical protein